MFDLSLLQGKNNKKTGSSSKSAAKPTWPQKAFGSADKCIQIRMQKVIIQWLGLRTFENCCKGDILQSLINRNESIVESTTHQLENIQMDYQFRSIIDKEEIDFVAQKAKVNEDDLRSSIE